MVADASIQCVAVHATRDATDADMGRVGGHPDFAHSITDIFKSWPESAPERFRPQLLNSCSEMIQLMENARGSANGRDSGSSGQQGAGGHC